MYCKKCGTENADHMKYCSKCGAQLYSGKKQGKRWVWISAASILAISVAAGILAPYTVQANQRKQLKSKLSLGEKYLEEMQYEKAAALYLDAIDIEDKEPDAYMGLAAAYLGLEEYDKADQAYEAAVTYKEKEVSEEVKQPEESAVQSDENSVQTAKAEEEIPAVYESVIQHYAEEETKGEETIPEEETKTEEKADDKSEKEDKREKEKEKEKEKEESENKVVNNTKESTDDFVSDNTKDTSIDTFSKDTENDNKNSYDAFYELIQKYEKEKGKGKIETQPTDGNVAYPQKFLSGLSFAKLADFDGDKSEELLVVYGTVFFRPERIEPAYTAEIWKYEDGKLRQLNQNLTDPFQLSDGGTVQIQLVQVNGQTYLIQGTMGWGELNEIVGVDKSGNFTPIIRLELSYDDEGEGTNYTIDGGAAEEAAYNEAYAKWCKPKKAYALHRTEEEEKRTLSEYDATMKTIKGKMSKNESASKSDTAQSSQAKTTEKSQGATEEERLQAEMIALEAYMNDPGSPMDHAITYCLPESLEDVPYCSEEWWFPIYNEEDAKKEQPLYYAVTTWKSDKDNRAYIYAAGTVDISEESGVAEATDEPEVIANLTEYY